MRNYSAGANDKISKLSLPFLNARKIFSPGKAEEFQVKGIGLTAIPLIWNDDNEARRKKSERRATTG